MTDRGMRGSARGVAIRFCRDALRLTLLIACSMFSPAHGQAAQAPGGSALPPFAGYDVVSVKPNLSGSGSSRISARNATFQATNVSLKMMLKTAYGVQDTSISGLPKWSEGARYDINAKIADPAVEGNDKLTNEQSNEIYRIRVRSILTDRFHLTAHKETKVLPVYDLIVLPGLLRFQKSEPSEEGHSGINVHNRNMTGIAVPLKAFADFLSDQVGRTVIDKTGLNGTYDLSLRWSPDELAEASKETGVSDRPPEIYTALQEQLGLKLTSDKGPSEMLVVDSVDPPAAD